MSTLDARIAALAEIYGQPPPMRRMTEREFDEWIGEKTRAEWVDGEVVMMAPVTLDHDDVVGWLSGVLRIYVETRQVGTVHEPEVLIRLPKFGASASRTSSSSPTSAPHFWRRRRSADRRT